VSISSKWLRNFFIIFIGIILLMKLLTVYTDFLWMDSVGQAAVFTKILTTRAVLGIIIGALFFGWLWVNIRIARRPLPSDVTFIGRRLLPEEEREQIEQYADRALLIFALAAGFVAALHASSRWLAYLQFTHATTFGYADPMLGKDAGFYIFKLGFLQYLWQACFYAVVIAFVVAVLVHLYQEAIRMVGNTIHALPRARRHCLGLLALALFLKIYGYRLAQYNLLYSQRGEFFSGASYVDIHANFPVLYLMMVLAGAVGIILLVSIRQRGFKLAGWSLAILVAVSFLGGTAYPTLVQRFVVNPTQLEKETPYAQRNITATNKAYNLDKVKTCTFPTAKPLSAADIQRNAETLNSIRLWDHRPLETTYDQNQGLRSYYKFADVDVDRYTVKGEYRQVMLSARQLDYANLPSQTWVNTYLSYTHGYGLAMSPVNKSANGGLPELWIKDLPTVSKFEELQVRRPGLYYMTSTRPRLIELIAPPEQLPPPPSAGSGGAPGMPGGEQMPSPPRTPSALAGSANVRQTKYVIVNSRNPELHYPKTGEAGAGANVTTHYAGQGGVVINSWLRRLAFAARFMDIQILLTEYIKPDSRIMINRYVPERLFAIAPFLLYDPDPYLALIDGQLKWICDAYTVSRMYPYSTRKPEVGYLNYIRNSLKIVVDGYQGKPVFYAVDPDDPILQCYQSIFPTLFTSFGQMPDKVKKHLRYPQLLFRIQAETYARYHMKDVPTFFHNEDAWAIPPELYAGYRRSMEAYYIIIKLPGQEHAEFVQMLPMVLKGREEKNLVAWMAARCDYPHYGELLLYDFAAGQTFLGPMMVESLIDQDTTISPQLSLWDQRGSRVIRGNTLVIPIEHSLLYVEPVYLESTENPFPTLHRVIVLTGKRIVMEPTLDKALAKLFGAKAVTAAERPTEVAPVEEPTGPPVSANMAQIKQAINKALRLETEAQQLLRQGDLSGYQTKQNEQKQVIEQLEATIK